MALDLEGGDINWSVQLGPLESWTFACVNFAGAQLNLTGVDVYLYAPITLLCQPVCWLQLYVVKNHGVWQGALVYPV